MTFLVGFHITANRKKNVTTVCQESPAESDSDLNCSDDDVIINENEHSPNAMKHQETHVPSTPATASKPGDSNYLITMLI